MSNYTDRQMIFAAQLSYLDFTQEEIDYWRNEHNDEYPTVRELLLNRAGIIDNNISVEDLTDSELNDIFSTHYNYDSSNKKEGMNEVRRFIERLIGVNEEKANNNTDEDHVKIVNKKYTNPETGEVTEYADLEINNKVDSSCVWDLDTSASSIATHVIEDDQNEKVYFLECADWKVYSVKDKNFATESGMFALTVMPSEGDAIVVFRGSEQGASNNENHTPHEQGYQFVLDWLQADFGLPQCEITAQERDAANYLRSIMNDDNFSKVSVSGHSLGGELALTAAALVVDDLNKFQQGISFDGPGHPNEFYKNPEIADNYNNTLFREKLKHYQYTAVGALYNSLALPENYKRAHVMHNESSMTDRMFIFTGIFPHSMYNIDVNLETGEVVTESRNPLAQDFLLQNSHMLADALDAALFLGERIPPIRGLARDLASPFITDVSMVILRNHMKKDYNNLTDEERELVDNYRPNQTIMVDLFNAIGNGCSALANQTGVMAFYFDALGSIFNMTAVTIESMNMIKEGKNRTGIVNFLQGMCSN